ncbi:hypothetical protein DY000_02013555 [Brassica cretica]|uniref:Uncharacterized protein n=1 Tax=Brassica cretica TaxID=69181 RepID=A0ABQ7CNJ6_BRACR|nr:hypothetical protein DY000_02013555 [Brassica cretica]
MLHVLMGLLKTGYKDEEGAENAPDRSPSSEWRQMLKICAVMAQPMMPSDRIADGPNIYWFFSDSS